MRTKRKSQQSAGCTKKVAGPVSAGEDPSRDHHVAAIAESINTGRYFIDGLSVAEAIIRRGGFRGNS